MTADLTGKLPLGTQKIRITTNLQIYWDSILIDRTKQDERNQSPKSAPDASFLSPRRPGVPRLSAEDRGTPPGNVQYIYEKASATGPYTRPAGTYTRYGDVLPLLTATDDKLAVFGSGDEVRLDFDPSNVARASQGLGPRLFLRRQRLRKRHGFLCRRRQLRCAAAVPQHGRISIHPKKTFPLDDAHVNYLLEYNTRHMSGNEQRGYWFDYGRKKQRCSFVLRRLAGVFGTTRLCAVSCMIRRFGSTLSR